jgi:regulatory protein
MRRRLAARGYDEKTVEDLVTRMMRLGYLDDRRFAESWVENRTRCRPSGPALLKHELLQRGVDEKLVREVLTARMTREVETDLAVEAARKRTAAGPPDGSDARAKRRLWDFLRRRGFGAAACQAAMKAVFGPVEELEDVPDDLGGADA